MFQINQEVSKNATINVIDEAEKIFMACVTDNLSRQIINNHNPKLGNLTLIQIKLLFDSAVIPAIQKVRALDREGRD